jgi:hypothetical protein
MNYVGFGDKKLRASLITRDNFLIFKSIYASFPGLMRMQKCMRDRSL